MQRSSHKSANELDACLHILESFFQEQNYWKLAYRMALQFLKSINFKYVCCCFLFIQSSRLYHWPTNPIFQIRMTMKTADWNQNIIEMRVIPNYKAHFWTKQSRKSVFQDGTFRINVELVLFISCVNLKIDW